MNRRSPKTECAEAGQILLIGSRISNQVARDIASIGQSPKGHVCVSARVATFKPWMKSIAQEVSPAPACAKFSTECPRANQIQIST